MDAPIPQPPVEEAARALPLLLQSTIEVGASDLLLHEGRRPQMRLRGSLISLDAPTVVGHVIEELRSACGAPPEVTDYDGAFITPQGQRFRVNIFRALGRSGAVLRRIRTEIPNLDSLGVPAHILRGWAGARSGMIIVCGPAGSGKTTTLAALLGWMNITDVRHVVTVEDPVEFLFTDGKCLFTQREVGTDTPSFAEGLRRGLRQSPDVIFVGEIRDRETAETALRASETGHLVLATLHSPSVLSALERMETFFSSDDRDGVRRTLASQLIGILCQRLLPSKKGGLALAFEFSGNSGAVREWISLGRRAEIADAIARGDGVDALPLMTSLVGLVSDGLVDVDVASAVCDSPHDLQRALKGIHNAQAGHRRPPPFPINPAHARTR
ncbi:MAG: type IV pilus twitching motility protein PilT [Terrimicrobiaceae bacterium]